MAYNSIRKASQFSRNKSQLANQTQTNPINLQFVANAVQEKNNRLPSSLMPQPERTKVQKTTIITIIMYCTLFRDVSCTVQEGYDDHDMTISLKLLPLALRWLSSISAAFPACFGVIGLFGGVCDCC
jgi:hypothetical protein